MELWLILLAPVAFVLALAITAVVVIARRHARIRNLRRAAAAGGTSSGDGGAA